MKISKGTLIRTIMTVLVVINLILKQLGHGIIDVNEDEVGAVIELLLEILIIITSFWKNNSYSKNAIKADQFLKNLREMDNAEEDYNEEEN